MTTRARCWCGTLQLEDETFDGEKFLQDLYDREIIKYGVGQIEKGSHYHFQFYLQFNKQTYLTALKKVNDKAHWEMARGKPDQNKAYCTKEDTRVRGPWEVGRAVGMGHRSDLENATRIIQEGGSPKDVADVLPSVIVRYGRGIRELYRLTNDRGDRKFGDEGPEVWIFWGEPGTGKSRRAFETWPDAYRKLSADKWWDGYEGQETVIFDDFKGSSMRLHDLQLVLDWYPMRVEVKGGSVNLSATRYVFTTNTNPYQWYSAEADPHGTITRRIDDFCATKNRLIHFIKFGSRCVDQGDGVILAPSPDPLDIRSLAM